MSGFVDLSDFGGCEDAVVDTDIVESAGERAHDATPIRTNEETVGCFGISRPSWSSSSRDCNTDTVHVDEWCVGHRGFVIGQSYVCPCVFSKCRNSCRFPHAITSGKISQKGNC